MELKSSNKYVSKRLHALRCNILTTIFVVGILSALLSCSNSAEPQEEQSNNTFENEDEISIQENNTISNSDFEVFVSTLSPGKNNVLADLKYVVLWPVISKEGGLGIDRRSILDYSQELHGYIEVYVTDEPFDSSKTSGNNYYIINNYVVHGYGDSIAPNTPTAIYKTGNTYVSVYEKKQNDYCIIASTDLFEWTEIDVNHPAPILLFEKENGLFALAGPEVWDISNPESPSLVQTLEESILKPAGFPVMPYDTREQSVKYTYTFGNRIIVLTFRAFEGGAYDYFITINTDDFSFTAQRAPEFLTGPYWEKGIETDEGWRLYLIGNKEDGTLVVDPFAEGGPTIVEELPGNNSYP